MTERMNPGQVGELSEADWVLQRQGRRRFLKTLADSELGVFAIGGTVEAASGDARAYEQEDSLPRPVAVGAEAEGEPGQFPGRLLVDALP
jgi:hypothetical protein